MNSLFYTKSSRNNYSQLRQPATNRDPYLGVNINVSIPIKSTNMLKIEYVDDLRTDIHMNKRYNDNDNNVKIKLNAIDKRHPTIKNENELEQSMSTIKLNVDEIKNDVRINSLVTNNWNKITNNPNQFSSKNKNQLLFFIKKNINCITNVCQQMYNGNIKAYGLGDFIRGCYFLMEFCQRYNFQCEIDFLNYPIKHFLKQFENANLTERQSCIYKKINIFRKDNHEAIIDKNKIIHNNPNENIYEKFMQYLYVQINLLESPIIDKNVMVYSNAFPMVTNNINPNFKKKMRDIFEPTEQMQHDINERLDFLQIEPKKYNLIHVRCGDDVMSNGSIFSKKYNFQILINDLKKLNPNKKHVLISDNNTIKRFVKQMFPFITVAYDQIVHTAEANEQHMKNTMLDFYTIANSSNVMSYSIYEHGSGFSKWCACTYDIPYFCKFINK